MLKLSPGPWDLPDYAMLGETGNGWAFAVESPEARDRVDRLAPGRDMWSKHTVVSIWDSTMDPPMISVNVDGKHDWMFWEYNTNETDHPLTRRLVAEGGFVVLSDRVHRDDGSHDVTMSDVYRITGEYYGLSLPRHAIIDQRLPYVFSEPRVLVRPQARCPVCGEQMASITRSTTYPATRRRDAQERSAGPRWPRRCARSRTRSTTTSACRTLREDRGIT
ncbi:hypothetical protein ACFWA5_07915 [Streptomyces mirabilis]|uniref:hypothetical protein n=1 Tax=Streptomyces mirabilis TaxID=68239 RepID=UPI003659CAFB